MYYKMRIGLVVVLFAALPFLAGCATFSLASGIGPHQVHEATGAMAKDYPKPMRETWDACLAACKDYSLKVTEQKFDPKQSSITAIQPAIFLVPELPVRVNLTAKSDQVTTVVIRFGGEKSGNPFYESDLKKNEQWFHGQIMSHLGMQREMTPEDIFNLIFIP